MPTANSSSSPQANNSNPHNSLYNALFPLSSKTIFALSKAGFVYLSQPLQVGMLMQQGSANSRNPLSFVGAVKAVLATNPTWGARAQALEKGANMGAGKEIARYYIYKEYMVTGALRDAQRITSQLIDATTSPWLFNTVSCIGAAAAAGITDTAVGGPLDRASIYLATAQGKNAQKGLKALFANKSLFETVAEAYRGAVPSTLKSGLQFAVFYTVDDPIKDKVRAVSGIDPDQHVPTSVKVVEALSSGAVVSTTVAPLAVAKTLAQKAGAEKGSMAQRLASVARNNPAGLIAGLPAKMGITMFGMAVSSACKEYVKNRDEGQRPRPFRAA